MFGPFKMLALLRHVRSLSDLVQAVRQGELEYGPALGQLRHALGAIGSLLVGAGFVDADVLQVIMGAVPTIFAFVWSFVAKGVNKDG